jgi:hypothetical protein
MAVDEERIAGLAADTAALAETAKWIAAGLAATGALLITGLQLADLGGLDDTATIAAAAVGAVVALGCFIGGALVTLGVLLPSRVSLEALAEREAELGTRDPVIRWVHDNRGSRVLRDGNDTFERLLVDYRKALRERSEALRENQQDPTAATAARAKRHSERAAQLNAVVAETLEEARHRQARRSFELVKRWMPLLAIGALVGVLAIVWAANEPAPGSLDLRGADLSSGELRDAELRGAVLDGLKIDGVDLRGTFLGGAGIEKTEWANVICPDGAMSADAGETCAGHLEP